MLINAKYEIFDNSKLCTRPNLGFFTSSNQSNSVNISLDFGFSYDVTKNISFAAKYNLSLNNFLKVIDDNFSIKLSGFYLGLG